MIIQSSDQDKFPVESGRGDPGTDIFIRFPVPWIGAESGEAHADPRAGWMATVPDRKSSPLTRIGQTLNSDALGLLP